MDLKTEFEESGYVVIDSGVSERVLNGAVSDLAEYFGPNRKKPAHVPFADHGRIQDAWLISQNVLKIAQSPNIIESLETLYGKQVHPFQTLNFEKGTEQPVHSDSIHFNSEPFGAMCGVWTALEDIGGDQGPLVYYPGSHKLPEMNYDYFGLKAEQASYPAYLHQLDQIIKKNGFTQKYGHLKKGQSLIWAANTLHGGSKQLNKELTRHSQVCHYYIGDVKPWRPVFSEDERFYFTPDSVRDVRKEMLMLRLKQFKNNTRAKLGNIKRKIVKQ